MLEKNLFVEPCCRARSCAASPPEEHAEYRRPFAEPGEGRRPTLTWPRQIPIEGEPADVVEIVRGYAEWLSTSDVPSCSSTPTRARSSPGRSASSAARWPNQTEVTVAGTHFIQEDSPDEIGQAIATWLTPSP